MKIFYNWKLIMVVATVLMATGFIARLWGIFNGHDVYAIGGLTTVIAVFVGCWTWVIYVISNIIKTTEITIENLEEVKQGIREVKILIVDYKALNDKYIIKG